MKQLKFLFPAVLVLAATACQHDPASPVTKPTAPTASVDDDALTRVSMLVNGTFATDMTDITSYGVEISETLFENSQNIQTLVPQEVEAGVYSLGITGLKPNSNYYLRSFISNGLSKLYSSVEAKRTPETSVASLSDVRYSADLQYLEATIEDDGGREITDKGFVWGTVNDRKSLRREKRNVATEEDGNIIRIPVSELGEGTVYVLAYAEDDKDATGFSRIPFERYMSTPQEMSIADVYNQRDGQGVIIIGAVAYAVGSESMVVGDRQGRNFIHARCELMEEYELQKGNVMTLVGTKMTVNGMAEIHNCRPENVAQPTGNLVEPEYQAYDNIKGKQFDRVQPMLLSGVMFSNEDEQNWGYGMLPMQNLQQSPAFSLPYVSLFSPNWEFTSEFGTVHSTKGFWLFRTEDPTRSGSYLDNYLIGEDEQVSGLYTWGSFTDAYDGTDGQFYSVDGIVAQIENSETGALYLRNSEQDVADLRLYIPSLVNLYGESPKAAPGGWEGFGVQERGQISIIGQRYANGNTIELRNAILVRAYEP